MIIKKLEINDDKGRAYIQRGKHHIGRWVTIKKNFITKRWQLKSSNIDIHDKVIELQLKNEFKLID